MDTYSPLDDAILAKSRSQIEQLLDTGHSLKRYDRYNHFGYLAKESTNNEFLIWLLKLELDIDTLYFDEPLRKMNFIRRKALCTE